jgi:hypothetical protein
MSASYSTLTLFGKFVPSPDRASGFYAAAVFPTRIPCIELILVLTYWTNP